MPGIGCLDGTIAPRGLDDNRILMQDL